MNVDTKLLALYEKLQKQIEAVETIRGDQGPQGAGVAIKPVLDNQMLAATARGAEIDQPGLRCLRISGRNVMCRDLPCETNEESHYARAS